MHLSVMNIFLRKSIFPIILSTLKTWVTLAKEAKLLLIFSVPVIFRISTVKEKTMIEKSSQCQEDSKYFIPFINKLRMSSRTKTTVNPKLMVTEEIQKINEKQLFTQIILHCLILTVPVEHV